MLTWKPKGETILPETMKSTVNEYEFQKLNADFDKKLDQLSEEYKRKTDEILHADRYGLDTDKRRNRLWMWFDRKTGYQLVPKIVIISFGVTVILLTIVMVLLLRYDLETLFSINLGVAFLLLGLMLGGEILVLLAVLYELESYSPRRKVSMDVVTNPAWRHLRCNVWHRETDE
jgi:hypothetical protein